MGFAIFVVLMLTDLFICSVDLVFYLMVIALSLYLMVSSTKKQD